MKQEVSFFHIPSGENKADILTRNHSGEPVDLPYVKDCQVDTTQAVLYSQDVTDVHSLPEVNTKQITSNQMSINNNSVGVANLNYLLHYNMLVAGHLLSMILIL